jgi:hypothetical protein
VRRIIGRAGAKGPFALGYEDIKEMAGIEVDPKAIERVSHQLGEEIEAFNREAVLSSVDQVWPIEGISKMYICMDGTGVPVTKREKPRHEKPNWGASLPRPRLMKKVIL